ncbi:hypothetical protein BG004_006982 [Podila humilis]|nr:hypothetical protein BG004_006982 [Podila humilis]
MDEQSNGSGSAELADRFREKVEARRRGQGQRVSNVEITKEATTTSIAESLSTMTVSNHTTSSQVVPEQSGAGLNERYKERANARIRGKGLHQPGFRGFSIKPNNSNPPKTDLPNKQTMPAQSRDQELARRSTGRGRQAILSLLRRETTIPDISDTVSSRAASSSGTRSADIAVSNHAVDEATSVRQTPSKVRPRPKTQTPKSLSTAEQSQNGDDFVKKSTYTTSTHSSSATRRISNRQSGQAPEYRLSWSKGGIVVEPDHLGNNGSLGSIRRESPKRRYNQDDDEGFDNDLEGEMDHAFDEHGMNDDRTSDHDIEDSATVKRREIWRQGDPSSSKPTSVVQAKRRRLIQEEADENDNPFLVSDSFEKPPSKPKPTSKTLATTSAPSTNRPKTTLVESDRNSTATSRKTKSKTTRPDGKLRQSTLAQLTSSKPKKKATQVEPPIGSTTPLPRDANYADLSNSDYDEDDDKDDDDDFEKTRVRQMRGKARQHLQNTEGSKLSTSSSTTTTSGSGSGSKSHKGKGSKENNVKVYKQLQIQCLKFLGPSTAASKPVTVRNPVIAKMLSESGEKAPAEGSTAAAANGAGAKESNSAPKKKLVQGMLQIEQAPLSEMDVIAEAVREVVDKFIDRLEDQALAKDMMIFRSELETVLIEQVDLLDDHTLLRSSVKKAEGVKREIRLRLLETQRQRHQIREKLKTARTNFEREDRSRKKLESTHRFLTDLEALRDLVDDGEGNDNDEDEDEEEEEASRGDRMTKTGLQSFIATVASRSCGGGVDNDNSDSKTSPAPGSLGALKELNRILGSFTT